jgi:hypothetical protein
MEKRAIVLALALTLPLALYGIPYVHAIQTSSTYTAHVEVEATPGFSFGDATCNLGDYATGGGFDMVSDGLNLHRSEAKPFGPNPTQWEVTVKNPSDVNKAYEVLVVCQSPVTVAGVTAPEFGSLYVAIALGAVIYFVLARQYAGKRSAGMTTA